MGARSEEPRTFHQEPSLAISFWRNLAVVDVRGDLTVEAMRTIDRSYRTLLPTYPAGIVAMAIVRPGVPVSSSEARSEGARLTKALGESLLRIVFVIEDNGVFAQAMRSVIRGLNVIMRNAKMTAYESVEEATQAVLPLIARAADDVDLRGELRRALQRFRGASDRPARASVRPGVR
jgi:hypothetical protein